MAHEFWIEPTGEPLAAGDTLVADLKVGTGLKGDTFVYLPDRFRRFEMINGSDVRPVRSQLGAIPAVSEQLAKPGLTVLAYQSRPTRLMHSDLSVLEKFAVEEGLTDLMERHKARQLPQAGFVEIFSRFAKALVPVGGAAGQDAPVGMALEVVVAGDFTSLSAGGRANARVLAAGEPVSDIQLSAFHRDSAGVVTTTRHRTDQDGLVELLLAPGFHLLNAVQMVEPTPAEALQFGAVWHSLWASTTFRVPELASGQ